MNCKHLYKINRFSGGYLIQNIDPEELLIMNKIF